MDKELCKQIHPRAYRNGKLKGSHSYCKLCYGHLGPHRTDDNEIWQNDSMPVLMNPQQLVAGFSDSEVQVIFMVAQCALQEAPKTIGDGINISRGVMDELLTKLDAKLIWQNDSKSG